MTDEEIDALAASIRDQAGQCERLVDLTAVLALVNAEVRIVRELPPAEWCGGVYYRQLDGFCVRGKRRHYIYINGRVTKTTRRRFTIAHEIGHVVMHDSDCSMFSAVPHLQDQPEREANFFAGCLLIPTRLLEADLLVTTHVPTLASMYGVSPQAMERAIRNRGEQD